jgi:hypothetical protein
MYRDESSFQSLQCWQIVKSSASWQVCFGMRLI